MEETISLKELFLVLRKRLAMIIGITFVAALVSAIVSFYFITPIYQSSTQILVNQKKQEGIIQQGEVQTNIQLINTYNVIIKSPAILKEVISTLQLNTTPAQLANQINVASAKDSQVISVTVQDPNPEQARDITNSIAKAFQAELPGLMDIGDAGVKVLAEAEIGKDPVKPRPTLNIAIALVVGLMASIGISFLLEYLDNTIKREQDVEVVLEVPVLGVITQIEEEKIEPSADVKKVREKSFGA